MKHLALLVAGVLISTGVHAEDADRITFCNVLPAYQQASGVEYVPGVDIKGQVVASADVSGSPIMRSFETIEIPVEADLVQRFGLNVPTGIELKPYVALISIHKDGRVDYNGQDISQKAHDMCNEGKSDEQAGPPKPE